MASISFGIPNNLSITGNLTVSTLTSGRVPFVSTGGLLVDDADFTFATDTLTATKGTFGSITHIANAIAAANSVTSVAGQNLVLAVGTGGTALTLTNSTLVATFAGQIAAASASAHTLGPVTFTNGVVTALTSAAAPTATALTLTGGDSGASISLGALSGGNASVTITPVGTGNISFGTSVPITFSLTSAPIIRSDSSTQFDLNNQHATGKVRLYGTAGIDLRTATTVSDTTASISTITGSLVVGNGTAGGLGVGGAIFGGSNLSLTAATSTITLGSTNTGSIAVDANGALTVTPTSGQTFTVGAESTISSSTPGSTFNGLTIINTSNTASSASSLKISNGGPSGGVVQLNFNDSGTRDWFIGVETGSDRLVLGTSVASPAGHALQIGNTLNVTIPGTGTHTFGTTNTVSFAAGAVTATAVGAHTFGTTNTVVMTAGVVTANGTGSHVFGTTNTVTMEAGNLTTTGDLTVSGGNVGVGTAPDGSIAILVRSSALTTTNQRGLQVDPAFTSASTNSGTTALFSLQTAASAFTMINGYGVQITAPTVGATSAVTTLTGLYIANQGATGITNAYGLDIASQSGASTINVGLRNAGTTLLTNATEATTISAASAVLSGGLSVTKNILSTGGQGWGVASTATAAGTTTLVSGSKVVQVFTGTTTQTVQLPAANLYGAGVAVVYVIKNRSTGNVTVQRAGSDTIDGSTSITLNTNDSVTLVSSGVSDWYVA